MKRLLLMLMLVISFLTYNQVNAGYLFDNSGLGFGISAGPYRGDNSGDSESWTPHFRAYMQSKLIYPFFFGQMGLGYTKLNAPGGNNGQTGIIDARLLLVPFSLENLNPYVYGGVGVTKAIGENNSDFLPLIPLGIGFQTRLSNQLLLELSGGYNLSLSDELDGIDRTSSQLNSLTNSKQDGFFGFDVGIIYTVGSRVGRDSDNDGLTNDFEKELGTNPKKTDTDGDRINDGSEVNEYKTNPKKVDTDGDGLNDGDEVMIHNTNPLKADSDGDGLTDRDEINQYKTYPLKVDSDNDALSDGAEVNKYKTDPLKADSDSDGLNDGNELKYISNPLTVDTDGDGLNDGAEVNEFKTDPAKADSDNDGLNDGEEVNKYKTNPLKIDTDGGSVADGAEIKIKTNPLNPMDDIVKTTTTIILEKGKKVILKGVNFETNKDVLTVDSKTTLEQAYKALVANPGIQIEISGHTDRIGHDQYNQDLSLRRAQAVRNWLVKKGIASNRMSTVGKGEKEPIADNSTKKGRAENRRIEFYVQQ